ncbi:MAG: 50S ribosomal protein L23 [Phycisphaeraceae bacterium]|nr:50S ribosomal protein L23 [Phycisphaeraceae bacterium]MCW5754326.1 50S ribosomal protein L23 [Phycisphaeraceae bacterium]
MIDSTYVIKKPVLTEKSTAAMNEQGVYTFIVDRRARKDEIKSAVESIYGVRVRDVRTSTLKGEIRRLRYGWVEGTQVKKAMVRLEEGQAIELF